ncbi:MAG TPA: hypothetical protein VFL13_07745 [Candidatus Baltobacteraceae bacterium]|nr:hypothetical protein [Candidatus Baltobacteraceae bacterium]
MRKRTLLTAALVLTAGAYAARMTAKMLGEWARYERIREMSDEGPLLEEMPKIAGETLLQERAFARELISFTFKFPVEIARYLRMESM